MPNSCCKISPGTMPFPRGTLWDFTQIETAFVVTQREHVLSGLYVNHLAQCLTCRFYYVSFSFSFPSKQLHEVHGTAVGNMQVGRSLPHCCCKDWRLSLSKVWFCLILTIAHYCLSGLQTRKVKETRCTPRSILPFLTQRCSWEIAAWPVISFPASLGLTQV